MRKAEIIVAFLLGLFSLGLMWKAGQGPSWDPSIARFDNIAFIEGEGPGSGFWPFWLSLIMFFCCLWIAYNWFRGESPPSRSKEPFLDSQGVQILSFVVGGLIGFLLLIFVVGFYGAIFVFLIYYIKYLGSHTWRTTLLISGGVPIFCFFFFDVAMRIILPKGYLEPLFLPLYDIFL